MSRKIIYKNNSTNQDQAVLIDEVNMPQNNGYGRFGDLNKDGNKNLNCRLFIKIAVVILAYLIGYFTCHLLSPSEMHHETFYGVLANLNNSNFTNYKNETNFNTTKSTLDNVTKFLSSTTEIVYYNRSETTRNVITSTATHHVSPTEQPRVMTTATPVTSTSTVLTTEVPGDELQTCLRDFTNRFEEINGTVTDKCYDGPIGKKSTIIFLPISSSRLFDCLLSKNEKCDKHFHDAKKWDSIIYGLKHVRYNFIMGDHGNLYEGRPLSCTFDDFKDNMYTKYVKNFESVDNSQIIVGMPACDKLNTEKRWERLQFSIVVKNLINCLNEENILRSTYTIKFHNDCKNYLHSYLNSHFRNRIVYFNDNKEEYDDYDNLPVY